MHLYTVVPVSWVMPLPLALPILSKYLPTRIPLPLFAVISDISFGGRAAVATSGAAAAVAAFCGVLVDNDYHVLCPS